MNLEIYGKVQNDFNLINNNSFKINAICKYFIIVDDKLKLTNLIKYLKEVNVKYLVLGGGSNIILPSYYDGVVIKLDFKELIIKDELVEVGASYFLNKLASETINLGLKGLEWAAGIPGHIGGSIVSNAGAYKHEICEVVEKIEVLENDEIKVLGKQDIKFSYRQSDLKGKIVLKAYLKLTKSNKEELLQLVKDNTAKRVSTQPLEYPSVGSVFRNPPDNYAAGKLIEDAGLKGYSIGGAEVSKKHANFIINKGDATSEDIISVINFVHNKVLEVYGIDLIVEPEII